MKRFAGFVDLNILKQSNALFGYEGDKYYFSLDIRKHFGLDRYTDSVIPYWKTETVEAMTAFRFKDGYEAGAGECVSLSALYAAAMFIIGGIPLEKIFLIATPLHSQNFINEKNGVITNNRRIVTKSMWFNGTSISDKARRALENEKVTIVSHITGHIHTMYEEATIDQKYYSDFKQALGRFLKADLTPQTFVNFLRTRADAWKCFQYRHKRNNRDVYVEMETIFRYEQTSKNVFSGDSRAAFLSEIDAEEFFFHERANKVILNDMEEYLENNKAVGFDEKEKHFFTKLYHNKCSFLRLFFIEMKEFLETVPELPSEGKKFITTEKLTLKPGDTRAEIVEYISKQYETNESARLSLYVYRRMDMIEWTPYLKASLERNPVCLMELKTSTINEVHSFLTTLPNESIYSDSRLALPDEVWNFRRGDGIEKAIFMMNFVSNKSKSHPKTSLEIKDGIVKLRFDGVEYEYKTMKKITKTVFINEDGAYSE